MIEDGMIRVELADGEVMEFKAIRIPKEIRLALMEYGAQRRLKDAARQKNNGSAHRLLRAWIDGQWSLRDQKKRDDPLTRAVADVKEIEYDEAEEKIKALTREQRTALRNDPAVAGLYHEYRTAKAGAKPGKALEELLS